ncbi:MAG: hypothetical protein R3208_04985 [Ketobacteraceae bacterium]|nr:hypothetical protein [Ketobacteraceae bacterium]
MNLNQTTVSIRPRNPYEAIDLGATMVRAWWKELWTLWFTVSIPFVVCIWFGMYQYRDWSLLLLWWCKPLWETVLLHFIAEKVFRESTSPREILARAPRLMLKDILLKLTLRRISITRSFDMPVSELENLSGTARNKRLNVLHRTSSTAAIWLTVVGAHLETLFGLAILLLIWMFIPEYVAIEMDIFDFLLSEDYDYLGFFIGYAVMTAVGPFYVASGFSLYINRRTILEGWDIELNFRQLASRFNEGAGKVALLAFTLTLFGLTALNPAPAHANYIVTPSEQTLEYTPKESRNDIIEVMESDAFNRIKEEEILLPKNRELETEEEKTESGFIKALLQFFRFIAQSIEIILWSIVIAAVVFILFKLNQYRQNQGKGRHKRPVEKQPDTLFGLDIRRESLPEDIIGQAKALWDRKQYRDAYSLLYRGALAFIAHEKQVPLQESFTEEECVAQFQSMDEGLQPLFFAQLTQQWQMVAYGHQIPAASIFDTTCEGWQFHFVDGEAGGTDGQY